MILWKQPRRKTRKNSSFLTEAVVPLGVLVARVTTNGHTNNLIPH